MKVIFYVGLPASGKTTTAKEFVFRNQNFVRINRDELRHMRGAYWIPKQEDFITSLEIHGIQSALNHNLNVLVDSTNLNTAHVSKLKSSAKAIVPGVEFEEMYFDTSPEECVKRDSKRTNPVGADVIWGMYNKYVNPPLNYVEDPTLPHCCIIDIDGTLAEIVNGRSPFDWSRVGEDAVQHHVKMIVNLYAQKKSPDNNVILFSGRGGLCAEITSDWLIKNEVSFHKLYMRKAGDNRKDSVVKREMFENHIRGKYFVDFVIDDRPQVLRMWVSLGLKVISNNPLNKEF